MGGGRKGERAWFPDPLRPPPPPICARTHPEYQETVPFRKMFTPGNQAKLQYFS